ncbi:MAG: phycobilisome rod-core linker polypeptide [Pseudanabaenaceae cyanobacterium bins.68]|nr:phycobilisome rod-core linker polypeptide [Pseudanabaenaceae cyanobacterium bins.68]
MAVTTTANLLGIENFTVPQPCELRSPWSEDDAQAVILAVYRHVLGNEYLMQSERLTSAESLLKQGNISVREFVRMVAKSILYRQKFFHANSQLRFIELNFKHLLGRAPYDEAEISFHTRLYSTQGYDAEIDAYLDSQEYLSAFGESTVPYYRGFSSQTGQKTVGFGRMFKLYRGYASSDRAQISRGKAKLGREVAQNAANHIIPPSGALAASISPAAKLTGVVGGKDGRLYAVKVAQKGGSTPVRQAEATLLVPFDQLSSRLQQLNRAGNRVLSVTAAK